MQARYYDPVIGRFLSNDPVGFADMGPRYFNRYSYTANDPINFTDPNGEERITLRVSAKYTRLVGIRGAVEASYDTQHNEVGLAVTAGGSLGASAGGAVSVDVGQSEQRGNSIAVTGRLAASSGVTAKAGNLEFGASLDHDISATYSSDDGLTTETGLAEWNLAGPPDLGLDGDSGGISYSSKASLDIGADVGAEVTVSANVSLQSIGEAISRFLGE